MTDRILGINAYTTLDLVDARAEGHDFEESAYATLNVTSPRTDPDRVELELELDNVQLTELPAHADRVSLSPEQARTVAEALESQASAVERAQRDEQAQQDRAQRDGAQRDGADPPAGESDD